MKKLGYTAAICLTTFALVASACGKGNNNDNTSSPAASPSGSSAPTASASAPPAKSDVTISYAAMQTQIKDIDKELAAKFEKETGIKVDIQAYPDDQYRDILKTKLATQEAPDIMLMDAGIIMRNYQPDKYLMDLSGESWVGKMKDWAINGSTVDGKLYGFNLFSVDGWGMLYNPEMFAKYNLQVPKTYADFVKVCQTLLDNGVTPIYENGKDGWHTPIWVTEVTPKALKTNPKLFDQLNSGEIKYSDVPEFKTALEQLSDLNKKGFFGKNVLSNDWDHGYEALATGKYAMNLVYTSYQQEVVKKFPDSKADTWKMFPIPLADNTGFGVSAGGEVQVVSKTTKHMDEIRKYWEFLMRDDNVKAYYNGHDNLGETSIKGLEVKPQTEGMKSMQQESGGDMPMSFEVATTFFDGATWGKASQDLLLNSTTPEKMLKQLDDNRAKSMALAK
ncbi:ABC transporter substrate-binding protein [Cohnella soli]|uniref:ABC transporter substrate-binding protein n=1 Tax=Cohnella soli TaxID=425005 RepID=A0ABW0HWM2_9BACL